MTEGTPPDGEGAVVDIDDVLARTKPLRRSVPLCLDGTISYRLDHLQDAWRQAVKYDQEHNDPDTAPAIAQEIRALQAEAEQATVTFTVQAIGATPWRRLVAQHPPPREEPDWRWDPSTFPTAAVAASCVEPAMTEDKAIQLAERLSDGQWGKLLGLVINVNVGDDIPFFASGIGVPMTSEPNSTTAVPEESLIASSLVNEDSPAPAS